MLNLSKFPWELPGMRFLMGMSCGALVVTERLYDPRPYRFGEHLVEADLDEMPEKIIWHLNHETRRGEIASPSEARPIIGLPSASRLRLAA
ncbi:MAG: glycosyltransferase family 1 protein [Pirellulales bacterium]|nr:glycosyltransferase family 1 protein [Pirellulales bacterium]